jgi:hypothetical protein
MKRSIPNLVSHISGLGVAPLFSYFPKPAFFAKTGMYRCISPETSMFLTTIFLCLPQLKSLSSTPDVFLAAQLNNFEGRF